MLGRGDLQRHSPGIPPERCCSRWALEAGSLDEVEEFLLKEKEKKDAFCPQTQVEIH